MFNTEEKLKIGRQINSLIDKYEKERVSINDESEKNKKIGRKLELEIYQLERKESLELNQKLERKKHDIKPYLIREPLIKNLSNNINIFSIISYFDSLSLKTEYKLDEEKETFLILQELNNLKK
jgi:hypothetical protein